MDHITGIPLHVIKEKNQIEVTLIIIIDTKNHLLSVPYYSPDIS